MGTPSYLRTAALSTTLDEMDSPLAFLSRLLLPQSRRSTVAHEDIEISKISGDRQVAGFVRRGGPARSLEGYSTRIDSVKAPHINVKRPINPWEVFGKRQPGMGLFPSEQEQARAYRQHVATEMGILEDSIVNTEEWMAAQLLQGVIDWSVADEEHFTLDFQKPASHETAVDTVWSNSSADPSVDFRQAKRLMNATHPGLVPNICLMSPSAADAFMALSAVKTQLNTTNFRAGALTIEEQYRDVGLIYLGRYSGIDCWEYGASLDVNGVDTPLIRTDFVEFVSTSGNNGVEAFYAAIPDVEQSSGLFVGRRLGKSWIEREGGIRVVQAQSRPLFVARKPGFVVSMDSL